MATNHLQSLTACTFVVKESFRKQAEYQKKYTTFLQQEHTAYGTVRSKRVETVNMKIQDVHV